ncbi:MAG: hypothetical protein MUC36_16145 [Planctomycetes bacterium]|nr:hypothetical protein [Planctomycetota bacterium]
MRTLLLGATLLCQLTAQAQLGWQPGAAAAGPGGILQDSVWWDPDGAGPRSAVLVIGGQFRLDSADAQCVVWWDPQTKSWGRLPDLPIGVPILGAVNALAVLPNGSLAVGGRFSSGTIRNIAIWNGTSWSSVGGGVGGASPTATGIEVTALDALPNGDLVVGGNFAIAGTVPASGVARWDGTQWHGYGTSPNTVVSSIDHRPNGNVIVVGSFPGQVAEWNGAGWQVFVPGFGFGGVALDLAVLPNGDVAVATGGLGVQRWNGSSWSLLGTGPVTFATALRVLPSGDLLAASAFASVLRWDGSQWSQFAPSVGFVRSLTLQPGGDVHAVGMIGDQGQSARRGAVRWDGTSWQGIGSGFDGPVYDLIAGGNGELVALGGFRAVPGPGQAQPAPGLAQWNGAGWSALLPALPTSAFRGAFDPSGTLWMRTQYGVLRLVAGSWQPLGGSLPEGYALTVDAAGVPFVGNIETGGNGVLRWDGSQWSIPGTGLTGAVHTLLRRANGDLIAGGDFQFAGATPVSRIARWDGTAWSPLGSGFNGRVISLAELPGGDLVAGGEFDRDGSGTVPLSRIARWNGSSWSPFGSGIGQTGGYVAALLPLPTGELIAGGVFFVAGGVAVDNLARWNGTGWQAVDGGVDGFVTSLAIVADGSILVGGGFGLAGNAPSAHFGWLTSNFPAMATSYGAGCAGAAGPLQLWVTSLPWLGATARTSCSPSSATAVGLEMYGLVDALVPLDVLLPIAAPGCSLLLAPEIWTLRLPVQGKIAGALMLPSSPTLLGVQVRTQMLVGELASGGLTQLASSNGVLLTLGSF